MSVSNDENRMHYLLETMGCSCQYSQHAMTRPVEEDGRNLFGIGKDEEKNGTGCNGAQTKVADNGGDSRRLLFLAFNEAAS